MFAGFLACVACKDFTGLSAEEEACKRVSENAVASGKCDEMSLESDGRRASETRWELVARRVTSCEEKFQRSPLIERLNRVLVRLSIACDECSHHGDERRVNSDRWI